MVRFLSRLFLILALFGLTVPAATACAWDRETVGHEREFKSDYLKSPGATPTDSENPAGPSWNVVALSGLGVAMILGGAITGTVMVVRRR